MCLKLMMSYTERSLLSRNPCMSKIREPSLIRLYMRDGRPDESVILEEMNTVISVDKEQVPDCCRRP